MSLLGDIKNNVSNAASNNLSSITSGYKDLINLNTLAMPNINLSNLFKTISGITNSLSDVGSNDTTPKSPIISGIKDIWTNKNDYLGKLYSESESQYVTHFLNNIDDDNDTGNSEMFSVVSTDSADRLNFQTPDWTYADFINDRAIFQKSLQNPLGEKGWFYFKIFFNFDTQYGLLGGLLNNKNPLLATNSAYKYLRQCENLGKYYKTNDRQVALMKFAKILSYISTYAPWFFKGIKNLNQANVPILNDFSKERSIEIECTEDAIDMRLNTLLDLYKFACYDEIDQKEIVPDNLRKFDMTVMVFQSPIRYFHTSFITDDGHKYKYKGTNVNRRTGFSDTMSFKMFTFINCEIDVECLGNMIPGSMNNEKPFTMGNGSIKITYDRVYTHTMNEFMHIMFGNDGLYYDGSGSSSNMHTGAEAERYARQSELQRQRIKDIKKIHETKQPKDPNSPTKFKSIIDASEALCTNNLRALGFNALGNFNSGEANDPQIIHKGNDVTLTEYYKLKQDLLNNRTFTGTNDFITSFSGSPRELISSLIDTYNQTLEKTYVTWNGPDNETSGKRMYTDGRGHLIFNSPKQQQGNEYWLQKLEQMKDGVAAPEMMIENTGINRKEYQNSYSQNYSNQGYQNKLIGSRYWRAKLTQLNDGVAAPEAMIENSGLDRREYQNSYRQNYSERGYENKLVGSRYWYEKIAELNDGRSNPGNSVYNNTP